MIRILLAEDDEAMRAYLSRALENAVTLVGERGEADDLADGLLERVPA